MNDANEGRVRATLANQTTERAMKCASIILTAATLALGVHAAARADSFTGADYKAGELLSPCQESDNDARWGEAAETECEQYLIGFADAMMEVGQIGPETGICPPRLNTADEIRWAFMRWVHEDYSARLKLPAADAVLATLKASFPCE
ncbi:MAG: Rap1a/Tai family immunity protein [Pseudomonadota bacterium]